MSDTYHKLAGKRVTKSVRVESSGKLLASVEAASERVSGYPAEKRQQLTQETWGVIKRAKSEAICGA